MAALTVSIWYVDDRCELEPIGPKETLKPGESASFTESWWLLPYDFPVDDKKIDLTAFEKYVKENTR